MLAVSLHGLRKRIGSVEVLDGIDLDVPQGSICGLLGLNGAGKTTLLRLLMGFVHASGGTGSVLGHPLGRLPGEARAALAYVPEQPGLFETLRVGELMRFVAQLHPRWDQGAADGYMRSFGLPPGRRVRALSTGMRSQLALAVALACRPDLLLLDEPAAGLDPVHRRRYLQVLLEAAAAPERTVLLASQDLALVERACDHLALIHDRRIQVAGPIGDVLERERRLVVSAAPEAAGALRDLPGARSVRAEGHGFIVTGSACARDARGVAGVTGVQETGMSLEELFWSYVEP